MIVVVIIGGVCDKVKVNNPVVVLFADAFVPAEILFNCVIKELLIVPPKVVYDNVVVDKGIAVKTVVEDGVIAFLLNILYSFVP